MIHNLKPYPAYKDSGVSWLGKVPEHWVVKRLKQCVERFYAGGTPDSGNGEYYCDTSKGLPWLMIADMTHQRHVKSTVKAITEKGQASKNLEVLPKGTLLYSMYASLGTVSVLEIEAAINQAIIGIKTRKLELETEFTLYFLESLQPYVALLSNSSTQANLNAEKVRSLPIYIPSLPEQSAIIRYLDHIDRRIRRYIRAKNKLIKLLEEQKQAIIHQAVTRGLDPNVKLKPSGVEWLGDIPENWEVKRLKTLVTIVTSGSRGWSNYASDYGPIFIRIGNLTRNSIELDLSDVVNLNLPHSVEGEAKRTKVEAEDLLLSITAFIGSVAVVPSGIGEAYVNQHIARCALRRGVANPRWVAYVLLSPIGQSHGQLSMYGGTKQGLSLDDVKNYLLVIPPRKEQELLVQLIEEETHKVTLTIDRTRHKISLLREYRTRLIADVVTGKLDVREAAANLPEETDETESFDDTLAEDEELESNQIEDDQAGELEEEVLA